MSAGERPERDFDLTGLTQRLRALNPGYSAIHVEAPKDPNAAVRVIIETTREELARTGGALLLEDPDLEGVKIEATVRFRDGKPGERLRVELKRRDA